MRRRDRRATATSADDVAGGSSSGEEQLFLPEAVPFIYLNVLSQGEWRMDEALKNIEAYADDLQELIRKLKQRLLH